MIFYSPITINTIFTGLGRWTNSQADKVADRVERAADIKSGSLKGWFWGVASSPLVLAANYIVLKIISRKRPQVDLIAIPCDKMLVEAAKTVSFYRRVPGSVILMLYPIIGASVIEEVVYRFGFQKCLLKDYVATKIECPLKISKIAKERLAKYTRVAASTAVFAASHMLNSYVTGDELYLENVITRIPSGLMLSILQEKEGLPAAITLHSIINAVSMTEQAHYLYRCYLPEWFGSDTIEG